MNTFKHGRFKYIYLGIDFADRHDYTCVVVVEDQLYYGPSTIYSDEVVDELGAPHEERGWRSPLELSPRAIAELARENNRVGFEGWPKLVVREIRRFRGIGYPRIVREIEKLLKAGPLRNKRPVIGIVADRGGVGLPPIQELVERHVGCDAALFIHGGTNDNVDGRNPAFHNVAQRNLIGWAQGMAEKGELKFAPALPLAEVAKRELMNFRVNQDRETNHESFGAPKREGEHDDTVYSLAMSCWYRMYHIQQEARYLDTFQYDGLAADLAGQTLRRVNPWAGLHGPDPSSSGARPAVQPFLTGEPQPFILE